MRLSLFALVNNFSQYGNTHCLFKKLGILLYICNVLSIVQCQLSAESNQFIEDFRSTSPGFASLFPLDDVCTVYSTNFQCNPGGELIAM